MRPDDVAQLKMLEQENAWLKRLLAEKELNNEMLKIVAKGKMVTPKQKRVYVLALVDESWCQRAERVWWLVSTAACTVLGVLFDAQAGDCTSNHQLLNL
jgi:hypothetical protein